MLAIFKIYIVDPNGDIIIRLLFFPNEIFAPWRKKKNTEPDSDNIKLFGYNEFEAKILLKYLALILYYFETILSGPWFKIVNCANKLRHIYLKNEKGFNPDAFKILLNIIHNKNKIIPRSVNFEILVKIAIMVDYFQYYETFEIYINIWIELFTKKPLPTLLLKNLVF